MFNKILSEINNFFIIDIGSSGGFQSSVFQKIVNKISYIGFEPNSDEFYKQSNLNVEFKEFTLLPYAIGGDNCEADLYITKSPYCSSLLEPDIEWIRRLSYSDLFEMDSTERIELRTLDSLDEIKGLDIDFIKCDTQGLELPILQNAKSILHNLIGLETETGFVKNYKGETTFSEIDEFLRDQGFLLFDLKSYRVSRKNFFSTHKTGKEQLIWTEALWFRDYHMLYKADKLQNLTRAKAKKVLLTLALYGIYDYGLEVAQIFNKAGLLNEEELTKLSDIDTWRVFEAKKQFSRGEKIIQNILRILPTSLRIKIMESAEEAIQKRHLLKG